MSKMHIRGENINTEVLFPETEIQRESKREMEKTCSQTTLHLKT